MNDDEYEDADFDFLALPDPNDVFDEADETFNGEHMTLDEYKAHIEAEEDYGVPKFLTKRDARVYRFCLLGASNEDLCKMLNVSKTTFNRWRKTKPEFARAINLGKQEADTRVVESLFNRAVGYTHKETKLATHMGRFVGRVEIEKHYPPDVSAIKMWVTNRESTKDKWQDVSRTEMTGKNGQPLQTMNANFDVNAMSPIEKASRLVTILQQGVNANKLKDVNDDDDK